MAQAKDGVVQRRVAIVNERGLHARAAAKFVKAAEQFDADIIVTKDGVDVPGTSIMGLLMLAAAKGCQIDLRASGQVNRSGKVLEFDYYTDFFYASLGSSVFGVFMSDI